MTSFADAMEYQELLAISKEHLETMETEYVRPEWIAGVDNLAKLKVSTVFAAISIEAALNAFLSTHCLFIQNQYLQEVFGATMKRFLRASVHDKIKLVQSVLPDPFPQELVSDVKQLFQIRNRVTHQSDEFVSASRAEDGKAIVRNRPLTNPEMQHMRRHHDIAHAFLSRFWHPGSKELEHVPQPVARRPHATDE